MDRATALARLKAIEPVARSLGIARLSLFGSTARDEATGESDLDLAVMLDPGARIGLFRFAAIRLELERLLDTRVDLVTEPNRDRRLQAHLERDRVDVF